MLLIQNHPRRTHTHSSRRLVDDLEAGTAESIKSFDKFIHQSVYPFADVCDDLGGMKDFGKLITETFEGMRYILVLASRSKKPEGELATELQPYMTGISEGIKSIRALRLDRDYDSHLKAIFEMLSCVSWVYMTAPNLPAPFIRECIGSSDFWSNRIRKDFKGKDDDKAKAQIEFCDKLKKLMTDLATYVENNHKTGLEFNPKGVSLAETAIRLTDDPQTVAAAEAAQKSNKRGSVALNVVKGGNLVGLMSELSSKKNADGTSAATGLKKVSTPNVVSNSCQETSPGLAANSFNFIHNCFQLGHQRSTNLA